MNILFINFLEAEAGEFGTFKNFYLRRAFHKNNMAGIYIHIPFCKQACHYCNFHFSTALGRKEEMVRAILLELERRKDYLGAEKIETIYFGGGTPSLLSEKDLNAIFEKIHALFAVEKDAEITLEANPDDLDISKLAMLKTTPVNRFSIGVQSFFEEDLKFMNRAHDAAQAKACIQNAQDAGFENLTIDLIYGAPTTSDSRWRANLQTAFDFKIPHLSCYALTVEPKTALAHFVKAGKMEAPDDERAAAQFEWLIEAAEQNGYEQYEISNFAKAGWYSRHNSSYWKGKKYLGVGPSAHSFDGESRQWNIANNARYMKVVFENETCFEKEILTPEQRYNEYVMTSLRTSWGCDENVIRQMGAPFEKHFLQTVEKEIAAGLVEKKDRFFVLSKPGKLVADRVAMELFMA